jgi:endonuclease/exonuclease/phosphatase family metal-dependent hydrolase
MPLPRPLRPLLALLALTLLAACQPAARPDPQTPAPARNFVRIATWNLEHLAESDRTGCRPRGESDYAELRRHADQLDADVIAIQEVENERAAARVFPADRWTIVMSGRPETQRAGFCRGTEGATIRRQDVGFAIRRGIPFRRNPDVEALGLGNPDLRWGVDISLLTPAPLRLLAVHLKSGCNAGRDANDRDCDILFGQAPVLQSWIAGRVSAGEAFAIVGDWNRRTGIPGDPFVALVDPNDRSDADIEMADAGRRAACVARYPDYIDHIGLGRRAAARILPSSFREYSYGLPEQQHPADHCPSMVDLRAR